MTEKQFSEITCPTCKEKLQSETPKTLKQWKAPLIAHLIVAPAHHLKAEEAEEVVDSYLLRLRYFLKLQEQKTEKTE
jgi:hypothetical protein